MGKSHFLSGKDKVKLIVSIVSLPAIVAVGVALGIGNAWAFGDGPSIFFHCCLFLNTL